MDFGKDLNNHWTTMQYPYDSSGKNKVFDGKVHKIIPMELAPIVLNGMNFSVLRYYDLNTRKYSITLLIKIGDVLAKVPLDNYDVLIDYVKKNRIFDNKEVAPILPPIKLAQSMSVQTLFYLENNTAYAYAADSNGPFPPNDDGPFYKTGTLNNGTTGTATPSKPPSQRGSSNEGRDNNLSNEYYMPTFDFKEYLPLLTNGNDTAKGGTFSKLDILYGDSNHNLMYVFEKAPSFSKKDEAIKSKIKDLQGNTSELQKFKFKIYVEMGTVGIEQYVDNTGKIIKQPIYFIPGFHEYTIVSLPCKYNEDCIASKLAKTLVIYANFPEYNGSRDIDRVFYGGCKRNLPIEFYNGSGRKLSDAKRLDDAEKAQNRRRI